MTSKHRPERGQSTPVRATGSVPLGRAESLAVACALFAAAYWLFLWIQPWVVALVPARSPDEFSPWARWAVPQQDGREVPVAFAGIVACAVICFEVTRRGWARRALSFRFARWACYGAALWIVIGIRSTEFSHNSSTSWVLLVATAIGLYVAWHVPRIFASRWSRVLLFTLYAVALVLALAFTTGDPSLDDYGYFIGPALEWKQGAALGSFYMQYSTLALLVTSLFMRLGLHVDAMQLAFGCVAIAWFGLYWWLARELIRDRVLRALFMIALLGFRVLWMRCHIASIPQVMPFRMDLWVPLVLVAKKRGLASPWTAACCGILYVLDGLFGFFYVVAYLASIAVEFRSRARRTELGYPAAVGIFAPILLAAAFNVAVFGSLVASSATRYMDVKLGFMPIDPASLFWAVLLVLLAAVVVLARADAERRSGLFLISIAIFQITYFLGRSHDHNLVNIGGVWILVAFVALDLEIERVPRATRLAAALLMLAIFGLGSGRIVSALRTGFRSMVHGRVFDEHPLDQVLDATRSSWPTDRPDVILLGSADAYMNYRLGLHQHGYYSPIFAHILLDETSSWFYAEVKRGQRVLVPVSSDADVETVVAIAQELNRTPFMTGHGEKFGVKSPEFPSCVELALAP